MSPVSCASATNQRLDAARRLIQQSQTESAQWLSGSLESSAIFQLRSAVNGLLQEIAHAYRLDLAELSIGALSTSMENKGVSVPALVELGALKTQRQSWLSQLFDTFEIAFECRQSIVQPSDVSLIGKGSDAGASAKGILDALVEVVLRFREDASEY